MAIEEKEGLQSKDGRLGDVKDQSVDVHVGWN